MSKFLFFFSFWYMKTKKGDIALTWVVISIVLKTSTDKESEKKLVTDSLV